MAIPFLYRLILLYIEPFLALNGAFLLLRSPSRFLNAVSPHHPLPGIQSNLTTLFPAGIPDTPDAHLPGGIYGGAAGGHGGFPDGTDSSLECVRILTDMLGIMHLVFAFNLAVVLRVTSDAKIWRVMCGGMLLSDVLHVFASAREYATEEGLGIGAWRVHDWANWGIIGAMGLVRAGVVLGIGMGERGERKVKVR